MSTKDLFLFSRRMSIAVALLSTAVITVVDLITPAEIMVSIFFVVPVLIVAWHNGFFLAIVFAVVLSWSRFIVGFTLKSLWSVEYHFINALDRTITLAIVSFVVARLSESVRHIRTLEGLLPICSHCKKIRDDGEEWQPLEKYLTEHSDAKFTHGLCPECAKIYFPNIKYLP
jgi:hypothetical protein